jgi:hypothetical protein
VTADVLADVTTVAAAFEIAASALAIAHVLLEKI